MEIRQVVLILAIILLLGFLVGTFVFLVYVLRLGQKYAAYKIELQKEGKYQEWISQHKGLVIFEKVSLYLGFVFLIAVLVFGFGMREFVNSYEFTSGLNTSPNVFITISGILTYLFYPYALVSLFVNSRLYKKIPQNWQQR